MPFYEMIKSIKIKRLLSIGLVLLALLGLSLIVGGTLILNTDRALELALKRLNAGIPGTVALTRHEISMLDSRLELNELVVTGPANEKLFGFDHLIVDWSWAALLKREIRLERVAVQNPWALLEMDAKNGLNLLQAFPSAPDQAKTPPSETFTILPIFNLVIQDLALEEGRVSFTRVARDIRFQVNQIHLDARGNLAQQSGELALTSGLIHVDTPRITTALKDFRLQAGLRDGQVTPFSLAVQTPASSMVVSGTADNIFTEPLFDLTLKMVTDLDEAQQMLKLAAPYTGQLKADLKLTGPLNNPDASIDLNYGGGQLAGVPITKIEMGAVLRDRIIDLVNTEASLAQGRVTLKGKMNLKPAYGNGFFSPSPDLNAANYKFQGIVEGIHPAQLASGLTGILDSHISIEGRGLNSETMEASAQLTGQLTGQIGDLTGPAPDKPVTLNLSAGMDLSDQVVHLQKLSATIDTLSLQAKGTYTLPAQTLDAHLSLNAPDFKELAEPLAAFGIEGLTGSLDFTCQAQGNLRQPEMHMQLNSEDLGFADYRVGRLQLTAEIDKGGNLTVSRLDLENQGSTLSGTARVALFDADFNLNSRRMLEAELAFKDIKPGHFMTGEAVQGIYHGHLTLGGSLLNPSADVSLSGEEITFRDLRLGNLQARLGFADKQLRIEKLRLTNRDSGLSLRGRASLFAVDSFAPLANPEFNLEVVDGKIHLRDFSDALKGQILLVGTLGGSLHAPEGKVDLKAGDLDLWGQKLSGIELHATANGKRVQIDPLEIVIAPQETVQGRGWIGLDRSYDFCLSSKGVSLTSIETLRAMGFLDGLLSLQLCGQGTLAEPAFSGELAFRQLRLNDQPIDDYQLRLELSQNVFSASGNLDFDVQATYHLIEKKFKAAGVFADTRLAPYFAIAGLDKFAGELSGTISAEGYSNDLANARADLDLSRLDLFYADKPVIASREVKGTYADRLFSIPGARLTLMEKGHLALTASGSLDGKLTGSLSGTVPLQVAPLFMPELQDATGILEVEANLQGTAQNPDVKAEVRLNQIGLVVPLLRQDLHDLNGTLRIDNHRLTAEGVSGRLDDGNFDLAGEIRLEDFQPKEGQVSFNAHNLPIEIPETLNLLVNSQLELQTSADHSRLRGEILVLEGVYYRDVKIKLLDEITRRRRAQALAPTPVENPFLKRTQVNVILRGRNPLEVDNNLAVLAISPDLSFQGTLAQPTLTGRASVSEGHVTYLGKTFTVRKGDIDFLNPYKFEPSLDIISENRVRDWLITLSITGTPDELVFSMASVPEESHDDIVSLLLFGKTSLEFAEGKSGTTQSTQQLMAALVASSFGADIKKAAGIDILELETTEEGQASSDLIKVTVGKNLSRRLTVKYGLESKDGGMVQRAITEYKLLENFLLNGFQDTKGIYGGEMVFRLEFR